MLSTDLTVGTLVEQNKRFLTIEERVSGAMVVTQPGGHIEAGETPEVAAARETLEESGCRVVVQELLGVYLWVHPRTYKQHLRIMFFAKLLERDLDYELDDGIAGVHWLSLEELKNRQASLRTPVVTRCVEDYLSGQRRPENMLRNLTPSRHNVSAMLANASIV